MSASFYIAPTRLSGLGMMKNESSGEETGTKNTYTDTVGASSAGGPDSGEVAAALLAIATGGSSLLFTTEQSQKKEAEAAQAARVKEAADQRVIDAAIALDNSKKLAAAALADKDAKNQAMAAQAQAEYDLANARKAQSLAAGIKTAADEAARDALKAKQQAAVVAAGGKPPMNLTPFYVVGGLAAVGLAIWWVKRK